ncbi:ribosomal RNA small subunit methyltransferase A [Patescibacteria group bacterium]|nr:ribosomal RNA small subunit methyltransferase A [Patescibacteria group bacterium]
MVTAKKSLGQNFLKDQKILQKIIEAGELTKEDTVVEVGPGKAALTTPLLQNAGHVIAVEKDDRLIPSLQSIPGLTLIHGDALTFDPPKTPYKLIANIPYYITSPILNHFLLDQFQSGNPPTLIVIMIQKEVAEKILAPGGRHSVLSLQVHLFGEPSMVCPVPSTAFDPQPKVDSAVIKIRVFDHPRISADLKKLFWLFHMSFAQKRKKLSNNLANAFHREPAEIRALLALLKINPDTRAEELTLQEWEALFTSLHSDPHSSL